MKKLTGLVPALLLSILTFAAEINFVSNLTWKQVKEKAKKENKMIFFDAYTSWCGPCKYLENSVYTDEAVATYFNANYINVKFDMEEGEGVKLSEEFDVTSYPTLLFFSAEGNLVHKSIGAMEAPQFIELGKNAKNPAMQYFTLKEKARKQLLTDADFVNWASMADQLEDPDKEPIIASWLALKPDILGNRDIAATVLMYTSELTDKQFSYLHQNKAKIEKLLGWDKEKTTSVLYNLLFSRAAIIYERTNNNIDSFRLGIRKFSPEKENYAVKDLQFRIAIQADKDNVKATALLIQYLKDVKQPLGIDDIAGWLLDYSSSFEKENYQAINAQLKLFKFRPLDKDKEYWLYLMQLVCEINLGNETAAKTVAEKAYRHPQLPAEYKKILADTYGLTP